MKHAIIKASFLILTMSVLTSSRENAAISNAKESLKNVHSSLHTGNEYAINTDCKKSTAVTEKKVDIDIAPLADNEVPLSPISRFILLQ